REPARRYPTARELADDLRRWLDGEPVRARPVRLWERGWTWTKRRPASAALIGVIVLGTAVGLPAVTWLWQRAEAARREETRAQGDPGRPPHLPPIPPPNPPPSPPYLAPP